MRNLAFQQYRRPPTTPEIDLENPNSPNKRIWHISAHKCIFFKKMACEVVQLLALLVGIVMLWENHSVEFAGRRCLAVFTEKYCSYYHRTSHIGYCMCNCASRKE